MIDLPIEIIIIGMVITCLNLLERLTKRYTKYKKKTDAIRKTRIKLEESIKSTKADSDISNNSELPDNILEDLNDVYDDLNELIETIEFIKP